MKTLFLKSLATVSLSILLVYSGVAWAFENCLENDEEHGHAGYIETSITSPESAVPSPVASLNSDRHPFTKIHCVVSHYQTGPMVQVSSGSSLTPSRDLLSEISLAGGSVIVGKTNSLWLHALFEWYAQLSSSSGVSRHLFLSVFRI
jgi:hypothetical protein